MNSRIYESPLGRLLLTSVDGVTLSKLVFDSKAEPDGPAVSVLDEASRWLDYYFAGQNPGEPPVLTPCGTEFQLRVWRELCRVGYGHTVTYGELARRVGCRSAQAVGNALGRNPILIMIPCHRVLAASGLGGFTAGIDRKVSLLRQEGIIL